MNVKTTQELSFVTLLLLISFASVNAVLFTPALPNIANFFSISIEKAQHTIVWFLIGYAGGQLLYGPFANRFGRKPTLYGGVSLQIFSSLLCVLAGYIHYYPLLVIGRLFLAIGSGVGLKITYTLINDCYEPKKAAQKLSYVMLAFAITPGLSVAIGGVLNTHFGWTSCFYAGILYGFILLYLITRLPETQKILDKNAFAITHLRQVYGLQFTNKTLITGALMMGCASTFVYSFAALAPFIAINLLEMTSLQYGLANILPPIGLLSGSICSAQLALRYPLESTIRIGVILLIFSSGLMFITIGLHLDPILSIFLPMVLIYFSLALINANAATIAMSKSEDKAHGAAVMSFINMSLTTVLVFSLQFFTIKAILVPIIFSSLSIFMLGLYCWLTRDRASFSRLGI